MLSLPEMTSFDGIMTYLSHADANAAEQEETAMVFLNFADTNQEIWVPFSKAGTYREMIDDPHPGNTHLEITVDHDGQFQQMIVLSNYGQIFIRIPNS
ncbi:MAG: hypothetical protein NVS2B7_00010 [Herpetosiphon sp.]